MRIYDERQNVQDCELYGSAHIRPQSHLRALLTTAAYIAAFAVVGLLTGWGR
jgi:hypothetical protein